ncbi:flagellar biosynthesis anti-sigma factor FlgM [Faecalispora anaeroviscerum]|uniref:flagellar biosynthesis anti-sigma factor FlgM n=1 Tax=Faecalispora anaeroviscerum TaxID=2991836 RepID=UPI0024BB5BCE|nr:flagellar biosynthesis anti-sigma factor FlgM [Faecalispora anaeroviscerum]
MMRIENQGYVSNTANSGYVNKMAQNSELNRQQTNGAKLDKISASSRRDTIEISQRSQAERPTLVQAKEQIVTSLHQEKSAEYLEELKSRIASGDYKVDSYELAGLLLDQNV